MNRQRNIVIDEKLYEITETANEQARTLINELACSPYKGRNALESTQ